MNTAVRAVAVCFLFLSLVLMGSLLAAGDGYAADPCPSGSYQRSCNMNSAVCSPDSIRASCKKINGNWTNSQLGLPCNQEISNCDGALRCLCGSDCPAGSYNQTCWCCYFAGSSLNCFCKNKKGKSVNTRLDNYKGCRANSIWNDNGKLKCQR